MRGKKVKQMRRDLAAYDAQHPVFAVIWPRAWYRKVWWVVRATLVRVAVFGAGLLHRRRFCRSHWDDVCAAFPLGKVIRLEPQFRGLKRTMRGKRLE